MSEKGRPLPKFGEWDVNDPASADGFTVIFNKARDEKKTGGKPDSPKTTATNTNRGAEPLTPQGLKSGFAACRAQARNLDQVSV
ncbi:Protein noi4 [Castilleja foliolosa]|uniref:Protein noi4 n=1 Tax=Castilleja foliolosa TaxID=1961234 RepID=A0ABD3D971_9LAMI